jgi:hypothetical protein
MEKYIDYSNSKLTPENALTMVKSEGFHVPKLIRCTNKMHIYKNHTNYETI